MRRQTKRADPRSVRAWNEFAVVEALRGTSPQRISELSAGTGLTPAPLGQVVRGLEQKGWVSVSEPNVGGRGRPALNYQLRFAPGHVLGLDVGAHAIRAVLVRLDGQVVASRELRVTQQVSQEERFVSVEAVLTEVLDGIHEDDVWLTVLAVGGRLSADGVICRSVAVPEWEGRRPAEMFRGVVGTGVKVVNDVRASIWAEHRVGVARQYDDIMLAHLGRRPTLGLLLGGQPRSGAHGSAGDMSRQDFLPTEEDMSWVEPFRGHADPLGEAVRAALAGDATLVEGARRCVHGIAPALAFAAAVMDPEVMVVSGALAPLAPHFADVIQEALEEHLDQPPDLLASSLDQFSTALGAALMGTHDVLAALASPTMGVAPFTKDEYVRLTSGSAGGTQEREQDGFADALAGEQHDQAVNS